MNKSKHKARCPINNSTALLREGLWISQ